MLQEQFEDVLNPAALLLVDDQPAAAENDIIAEHRHAANPFALARRRHLVARAFANDIALKLGKRKQYVQCQPAQRGRRVELLVTETKLTER